eukprot:IDg16934t1
MMEIETACGSAVWRAQGSKATSRKMGDSFYARHIHFRLSSTLNASALNPHRVRQQSAPSIEALQDNLSRAAKAGRHSMLICVMDSNGLDSLLQEAQVVNLCCQVGNRGGLLNAAIDILWLENKALLNVIRIAVTRPSAVHCVEVTERERSQVQCTLTPDGSELYKHRCLPVCSTPRGSSKKVASGCVK